MATEILMISRRPGKPAYGEISKTTPYPPPTETWPLRVLETYGEGKGVGDEKK
jgi:hypothetical protein